MVWVRTVIGLVLKRLSAIASKTETDVDDLLSKVLVLGFLIQGAFWATLVMLALANPGPQWGAARVLQC